MGTVAGSSIAYGSSYGQFPSTGGSSHLLDVPIHDPDVPELRAKIAKLEATVAELQNTVDALRFERVVSLASLEDPEFRLRIPISVVIDSSGAQVTAHAIDLEDFGVGETEYEAVDDLRRSLRETYAFLLENESELGPIMVKQLARFRDVLVPA